MNPKPDVLTLLAAARPDRLEPDPHQTRRAHDLALVAAEPTRRVRSATRARIGFGAALMASAAVIAVVAVVVQTTTGPRRADPPPAELTMSARDTLLLAAHQSAKQPATTGKYWYQKARQGYVEPVVAGGKVCVFVGAHQNEVWTAPASSGTTVGGSWSLGATPFTARDEAIWKQGGSPEKLPPARPGTWIGKGLKVGPERAVYGSWPGGVVANVGEKAFSVAEIESLPTDPTLLKRRLIEYLRAAGPATFASSENAWLFKFAGDLLTVPTRPALRAAVYQLLAGLDGVRSVGTVKDRQGRTGQGVAMTDKWDKEMEAVEQRLVINPSNGHLLARETRVIEPHQRYSWAKRNTLISFTSYLDIRWTNATPPPIKQR